MPTRAQRRRMECIDGSSVRCRKAEVETRLFVGPNRAFGLDNPKRDAVVPIPVTDQRPRGPYAFVSERLQHGVVEALTSLDVPHADRDVSDHGLLLKCSNAGCIYPLELRPCGGGGREPI